MSRKYGRRSFFLLEIVIAVTLVGFFSFYFLHAALKSLRREREMLLELEFEKARRVAMMEILSSYWPKQRLFVPPPVIRQSFRVQLRGKEYRSPEYLYTLSAEETEEAFRLHLEEQGRQKRSYFFFASK